MLNIIKISLKITADNIHESQLQKLEAVSAKACCNIQLMDKNRSGQPMAHCTITFGTPYPRQNARKNMPARRKITDL